MMKVLVTGATGFIGSHLADLLNEKGYSVRCTIRKTSNLQWLKGKPYELIEASLSDKASLAKAVEGVNYIYHVAGLVAARSYDEFLKANRDGTVNLIEAAKEYAPNLKRFLYVSSQTAAGPSVSLEKPVTEADECKPLTKYGRSKKAAEEAVWQYKDILPITIVRPPAVYGPRDAEILKIFQTVKSGLGTMVGVLKPKYLSLIHSSDLVLGFVQAAESEKAIGNTYFIASEEFYTWDRLIPLIGQSVGRKHILKLKLPHFLVLGVAGISGLLGKLSSKPPVFNYEKGIDFIQNYWTCSIEKAKQDFGYKQQIPIDKGLFETAKWYKENKWL